MSRFHVALTAAICTFVNCTAIAQQPSRLEIKGVPLGLDMSAYVVRVPASRAQVLREQLLQAIRLKPLLRRRCRHRRQSLSHRWKGGIDRACDMGGKVR